MKKKLSFIIGIIFIFILPGCTQTNTKSQNQTWTILVYMNGSNLEMTSAAATNDLREMLYSGSNENVNVIVQTGGSEYWHNYYVDENRSQRWYAGKFKMDELYNGELKNMAQSDTLSDFLVWGINNYNADHYAVILWNHGGGAIAGFGLDETTNGDTLILSEMKNAFDKAKKETGVTFDLVAFDACLMSNIETAYVLSPYSEYMAASEGLVSEMGYAYDVFLNDIKNNTDKDGEFMGKSLINSYIYEADRKGSVASSMAVLDLKNVAEVKTKFDSTISKINVASNFDKFAKAAYSSAAAGKLVSMSEQANMVDMGDFIKNISNTDISADIDKLVVYKASTKNNKENLSGISMYFPYSNIEYTKYEYQIYKNIGFSDAYTNLLKNYINVLSENAADKYLENTDTKGFMTNTKSLLNTNLMQGYKDGETIKISYVYPYSANDQNNKIDKNYLYTINSVPITVYKKDDSDLLYTSAIISGQYCEIIIGYSNGKLNINEAVALKKSKNGTIIPLKTFMPKAGDTLCPITLYAKNNTIKEDMSKTIDLYDNTVIERTELSSDNIKLMLSGLEIKQLQ